MLDGGTYDAEDTRTRELAHVLRRAARPSGRKPQEDAAALIRYGRNMRTALLANKLQRYRDQKTRLTRIAFFYRAEVIDNRDTAGMVVGLAFQPGIYKSGHKDWFFIS